MTLREDLAAMNAALVEAQAGAVELARLQGIDPYRMLTVDGLLVLAPILCARAQVLTALQQYEADL